MQPDQPSSPCPTRRGRTAIAALLGALALAGASLLAGCGTEAPQDPAEIRRTTVEARLGETFTAAQAGCIVSRLDAATIRGLTGTSRTAAATAALGAEAAKDFDDAVVGCVTDPGRTASSTTTTAVPAPSSSVGSGN